MDNRQEKEAVFTNVFLSPPTTADGRPSIEVPLVPYAGGAPLRGPEEARNMLTASREEFSLISSEFQVRSTNLSLVQASQRDPRESQTGALPQVTVELFEPPKAAVKEEQHSLELDKQVAEDCLVDYHTIPIHDLVVRHKTDLQNGITEEDAAGRRQQHGPNQIHVEDPWLGVKNTFRYLFSGFGPILWPAAIVCFISWRPLGNPPDPANLGLSIVLFLVIGFQAIFTAYQEWKSNKVMNTISTMMPDSCFVFRNGELRQVAVASITIGDVVRLNAGMRAPADVRVVQVSDLKIDNSILTGETQAVGVTVQATDKNFMQSKNMVFMGACIIEGSGIGVVVAIGNGTVMGKIAKLTSSADASNTPLVREINYFMKIVVCCVVVTATLIALTWVFWLRPTYPKFLDLSGLIVTIIGSVVAFLPDGLPVCVTMALTIMAKRMHDQNVLVKSLPTVETLGMVDIIASDKTGTLTQNKMSVAHVFAHGSFNYELEPYGVRQEMEEDLLLQSILKVCGLCNRAVFDPETKHLPLAERKIIGDASDTALLMFCEDLGVKVEPLRSRFVKLAEIPFNSRNKWSLAIYRQPNKKNLLVMKGAAEIILRKCSALMMKDGQQVELTEELRKKFLQDQERLCGLGERVLGLCQLELDSAQYPYDYHFVAEEMNFPTEKLCFLGQVALIDPPREDVADAVSRCKDAGIRVMMVTGDHPGTALAISRKIGIVTTDHVVTVTNNSTLSELMSSHISKPRSLNPTISHQSLVIKGSDLGSFSPETWDAVLQHKEIVFARTTPEDKLQIVRQCQLRKHVVAVTGDGVNDAPALKQAQVGVAMGGGSEVAREAADLVLLDNKFSSIISGIKSGRLAFQNLKKVILFLLPAGSWSELLPIFASIFLGLPLPLSPFLMIVICVGTDVFPAMSMVHEQAESNLMHQPPRSVTKESLVNWQLYLQGYGFMGCLESLAGFTMYFWYMKVFGGFAISDLVFLFDGYTAGFHGKTQDELNELLWTAQTIFFVALVSVQIGNLMSTRTRVLSFLQHTPWTKSSQNSAVLTAIGLSLTVAIFVVYIPFFQNVFNTRPIPVQYWFVPYAFSSFLFACDELRKYFVRRLDFNDQRKIFW